MTSFPVYTIIHTTCHRQWGGLERRIFNESRWMAEQGHRIIIIAPGRSPLAGKAAKQGWQTFHMDFTRTGAVKNIMALAKVFRKTEPDILNSHGNMDSKIALAAAWRSNIPLVILSRHISAQVKPSWYNRLLYKTLCHYVFTTARYTTDHLIKALNLDPERVKTLPSGIIPPSHLPLHETARKSLAEELGLSKNARFIGYVGRISEDKGLECMAKAFLRISSKFPDHNLVFVGDGDTELQEHLKVLFENKSNRIFFTGFKENPWPYLRAFDCKVLASVEVEGISQSLLEAMYAGCPVIGSKVGGTRDIVVHKKTGLLFEPGDQNALSFMLSETLSSRETADNMSLNAHRLVSDRYTLNTICSKIQDLYTTELRR